MADSSPLLAEPGLRVDQYTGAITALPDELVTADAEYIDFGTTIAGSNSDAVAVRRQFESNFDDSIYSDIRIWAANQAPLTGHAWNALIDVTGTIPAVSKDAPLIGAVPLPKNGLVPLKGTAAGALSTAADLYVPADKSIQGILLQLATAALATPYSQPNSQYAAPVLFIESARTDYASLTGVGPTEDLVHIAKNLCNGHGFMFSRSDVFLEITDEADQAGIWHYLEDLNDSSVTHSYTSDNVSWKKYKPEVIVQQARGSAEASVTFNLGQWHPKLQALCDQNNAFRDVNTRSIVNEFGAASSRVRYCKLIFRSFLQGLGMVQVEYPRVVLTGGDMTPGGSEFGEMNFTAQAQIGCTQKRVLRRIRTSDTPLDIVSVPLVASVVPV